MPPSETERDQILRQFTEQCPSPTAAQVKEWARLHPECAKDFDIHAAIGIAREVHARDGLPAGGGDPGRHEEA